MLLVHELGDINMVKIPANHWLSMIYYLGKASLSKTKNSSNDRIFTTAKMLREQEPTTNLCSFVNTIFWGWLLLLWDVMIIIGLFFVSIVLPSLVTGVAGYWYMYAVPLLTIIALVCLVTVAIKIKDTIKGREKKDRSKSPLRRILSAGWEGYKNRFCPIISMEEAKNEKSDETH